MESLADRVPDGWGDALADVVAGDPFQTFADQLVIEWSAPDPRVFPLEDQVFRALASTPLGSVRAVILGQDPYPSKGVSTGLAFSAPDDCDRLVSLRRILAAREADLGLPPPATNFTRALGNQRRAPLEHRAHDAERHAE